MRIPDEAKCHICKRIFCCGKCRQKHQFQTHAIAVNLPLVNRGEMDGHGEHANEEDISRLTTIYVFCPICEKKPLALRQEIYAELLAHIEKVHLPLRCRKCLRQYTKIDDLREFSKCVDLAQSCNSVSYQSCDTDASKVTIKKAAVFASTISTQTSPTITKGSHETEQQQQHVNLTPISMLNLRWKIKGRNNHEEFISDSVSSIRNLSIDSSNYSLQQRRSIGQGTASLDTVTREKGKIIRSTSTPLQVCGMLAKPKETLTFNASVGGGAHMSSIYHSGYVLDEQQHTPATAPDKSHLLQPQQRTWKVGGRVKMSAATPLQQVMSKSIQKAFVEHGVGMLAYQGDQRRKRLNLSENSITDDCSALDLRLSPAVRRMQSDATKYNRNSSSDTPDPYQILLSAQKLTTESIIITRTRHGNNSSRSGSVRASSTVNASTTSTVYNTCESVAIITSSTSTAELSSNIQNGVVAVPPITPNTRIPGAVINKKVIKFETPQKNDKQTCEGNESIQDEKEEFYTPNPSRSPSMDHPKSNESPKQQIVRRQLTGEFSPERVRTLLPRPQGPRARPPIHACRSQKVFSCAQDIESDDDEIFLPTNASTHNNKKNEADITESEPGRLWSIMSSVMRLPNTFKSDRNTNSTDKDNANAKSTSTSSLIRRCASFAGSFVRTVHGQDDGDMQNLKRKRTQTLDNQYYNNLSPSASSSKRFRIQARKPIERKQNNYI